jgi:alkanesulfonate monooxygenase SsuD/methylene tetrahydromethanopterin reductase-like flavin-dependent oxidoreductase (luciferase family)
VGSHEGEYVQVGTDDHQCGHDLDDGIVDLHRAWRSRQGTTPGDTTSTDPTERYRQLPTAQPVPVWVGGSSQAGLRRAALRGDDWMPLFS